MRRRLFKGVAAGREVLFVPSSGSVSVSAAAMLGRCPVWRCFCTRFCSSATASFEHLRVNQNHRIEPCGRRATPYNLQNASPVNCRHKYETHESLFPMEPWFFLERVLKENRFFNTIHNPVHWFHTAYTCLKSRLYNGTNQSNTAVMFVVGLLQCTSTGLFSSFSIMSVNEYVPQHSVRGHRFESMIETMSVKSRYSCSK